MRRNLLEKGLFRKLHSAFQNSVEGCKSWLAPGQKYAILTTGFNFMEGGDPMSSDIRLVSKSGDVFRAAWVNLQAH